MAENVGSYAGMSSAALATRLAAFMSAETTALSGHSYTVYGRVYTSADLAYIGAEIRKMNDEVQRRADGFNSFEVALGEFGEPNEGPANNSTNTFRTG